MLVGGFELWKGRQLAPVGLEVEAVGGQGSYNAPSEKGGGQHPAAPSWAHVNRRALLPRPRLCQPHPFLRPHLCVRYACNGLHHDL